MVFRKKRSTVLVVTVADDDDALSLSLLSSSLREDIWCGEIMAVVINNKRKTAFCNRDTCHIRKHRLSAQYID